MLRLGLDGHVRAYLLGGRDWANDDVLYRLQGQDLQEAHVCPRFKMDVYEGGVLTVCA